MNKAYPIALLLSILYLIAYFLLANLGILFHFETASEPIGSISGWCERVSKSIFREPSNALSNLAFMVSGIMILRILSKDKQGSKNTYCHGVDIMGPSRVIYGGNDKPLLNCGARVVIETDADIRIIDE